MRFFEQTSHPEAMKISIRSVQTSLRQHLETCTNSDATFILEESFVQTYMMDKLDAKLKEQCLALFPREDQSGRTPMQVATVQGTCVLFLCSCSPKRQQSM